jgi:hypothetical protein
MPNNQWGANQGAYNLCVGMDLKLEKFRCARPDGPPCISIIYYLTCFSTHSCSERGLSEMA